MENRVLQFYLVLCWALGCFPAVRPCIRSVKFRFKLKSFIVLYSSTLFLFSVVSSYMGIMMVFDNRYRARSQAELVVFIGYTIIGHLTYLGIRATSIIYGARLIQLVRDLASVSRLSTLRSCTTNKASIRTRMLGLFLICNVVKSILGIKLATSLLSPTGKFSSFLQGYNRFSAPLKFFLQLSVSGFVVDIRVVHSIAVGFIVVVGMSLSKSHNQFMEALKMQLETPVLASVATSCSDMRAETMRTFHTLTDCFTAFKNVIGIYGVSGIVLSVNSAIFIVFFLIWPGNSESDGPTLFFTVLDPLLILCSGTMIENQDFLVPEAVRGWKWEFSAVDIFSINNALIPSSYSLKYRSLLEAMRLVR